MIYSAQRFCCSTLKAGVGAELGNKHLFLAKSFQYFCDEKKYSLCAIRLNQDSSYTNTYDGGEPDNKITLEDLLLSKGVRVNYDRIIRMDGLIQAINNMDGIDRTTMVDYEKTRKSVLKGATDSVCYVLGLRAFIELIGSALV